MDKRKASKWDPAEVIESKEDVLAFLEGALEEDDPEFLFKKSTGSVLLRMVSMILPS